MKSLALAAAFVLMVLAPFAHAETYMQTLVHDGIQREYTLFVPSDYSANVHFPLVVNIHGLNNTSDDAMAFSGMNVVAEEHGFLVAYPNAIEGNWLGGEDNIGFIDALTGVIASEYSIDQSRLYATGISQGGLVTHFLAGARPGKFAAIASVAGIRRLIDIDGNPWPLDIPLPDRPFPLLHIHGTADTIAPYAGAVRPDGSVLQPIEDLLSQWAVRNGGEDTLHAAGLPNLDPGDSSTVDLLSCADCGQYRGTSGEERVAEVLLYRVNDGGHNWPGDWRGWSEDWTWAHPVNYDVSGSAEIWEFFSRHELPASPGRCDINGDGFCDTNDIDAMTQMVIDGTSAAADRTALIENPAPDGFNTYVGDSDMDGEFDERDIVRAFAGDKYLTSKRAGWGEGDWDGDFRFDDQDFVGAFTAGGYLRGPRLGCDLDRDGICDANDIDVMTRNVMDGDATQADRTDYIEGPTPDGLATYIGDSDMNGAFDEQDFVTAFSGGKYGTGEHAGWAEGDWDGNFLFNVEDIVAAFISSCHAQAPGCGPRRGVSSAVPEPHGWWLLAMALPCVRWIRTKSH